MWVIKLGGSLCDSETLPRWLDVLAHEGRGSVVIVPGGGCFAEQVRLAQARWNFEDATAHHMALLAMEQYGLMLSGLHPDLVPAASAAEVQRATVQQRVPVWLPCAMVLATPQLVPSWNITSDSLAAWLAAQIAATCLVLVKSVHLNQDVVSARWLKEQNIVDAAFPSFLAETTFNTIILGHTEHERLRHFLRGEAAGGTEVRPD